MTVATLAVTTAALAAQPTEGEGAGWVAAPASAGPFRYGGPVSPPPFSGNPYVSSGAPYHPGSGGGLGTRGSGQGGFRVNVSVDVDGGIAGWMPWNWRSWR